MAGFPEGHCQMRTMYNEVWVTRGWGTELGLSPLMTSGSTCKPSPSLVSGGSGLDSAHPGVPPALRNLVGLPATFCWSPATFLTSRKCGALPKTTVFACCPRSSACPCSRTPPPSTWAWGGEFSSSGARRFLRAYIPFFRCPPPPPPFSSIHLKIALPLQPPSPSPGRERLVKGTVLSGGVPRRGRRCGEGLGARGLMEANGEGEATGNAFFPLPIMCALRSEEPPA